MVGSKIVHEWNKSRAAILCVCQLDLENERVNLIRLKPRTKSYHQ